MKFLLLLCAFAAQMSIAQFNESIYSKDGEIVKTSTYDSAVIHIDVYLTDSLIYWHSIDKNTGTEYNDNYQIISMAYRYEGQSYFRDLVTVDKIDGHEVRFILDPSGNHFTLIPSKPYKEGEAYYITRGKSVHIRILT